MLDTRRRRPARTHEVLDTSRSVLRRDRRTSKAAEGMRRLRELLAVAKTAGVPDGRIKIDLCICPRARLLHRHHLRDVPDRPARHRQRLLRRAVRQPRQPVHEAGAARRRRVARPRSAPRRDGGAEASAPDRADDAGAGAGRAVRRGPARRLPAHRPRRSAPPAWTSRSTRTRRRSASSSHTPRSAASRSP